MLKDKVIGNKKLVILDFRLEDSCAELGKRGLPREPAFAKIKSGPNGVSLSLQLKVSTDKVLFNKVDLLYVISKSH